MALVIVISGLHLYIVGAISKHGLDNKNTTTIRGLFGKFWDNMIFSVSNYSCEYYLIQIIA
jgi:hypothetical protein